jgi:hypothetical protein
MLTTGLSFAASLALVMGVGAVTDEPSSGDTPAKSRSPAHREEYLLLRQNDRMIQGLISREGSLYVVRQKAGVMRFPKELVEGSFATVRDAYRHKEERLPEDDPGERVKLARWCLNFHLTAEAREQLAKVLAISPDHGPAQAMLANLENTERRQASLVDPEVRQTAAEEVAEDRARATDAAVLRGAGRGMGLDGLPVIFNLPRPLAIRRAEDFARHIQPVLQVRCARCHNGEYEGLFQLVPITTPRQRTPDALRANLDATLRLVDIENPARSELLTIPLVPHGNVGKKRPIFSGSNDRAYQILAAWVNSLRPPQYLMNKGARPGAPAGPDAGEVFGSERGRPAGSSLDETVASMRAGHGGTSATPTTTGDPNPGPPAYRYRTGQGMVREDLLQADPKEFPLPYMLGGSKPTVAKPAARRRNAVEPATSDDGMNAAPAESPTRGQPAAGAAVTKPARSSDAQVSLTKGDSGEVKKSKKPVKIDPAILEKLLRRNAERTPKAEP